MWYILFLVWYFLSNEYSGVLWVMFLKYLRLKVIAIDWFLNHLIKGKETEATIFYEIIYHYKETSSFFVRKKSTTDDLQIKKTLSNIPDFFWIDSTFYKIKNMPVLLKILSSSWNVIEIKKQLVSLCIQILFSKYLMN